MYRASELAERRPQAAPMKRIVSLLSRTSPFNCPSARKDILSLVVVIVIPDFPDRLREVA